MILGNGRYFLRLTHNMLCVCTNPTKTPIDNTMALLSTWGVLQYAPTIYTKANRPIIMGSIKALS
jgi:hypothetical protein